MGTKARAAGPLLRRIGVALKTFALYPPPSPVADNAVAELLHGLYQYLDTYGPLVIGVSKRSLHVDDVTFKDIAAASLAFHLYTRKIVGLTFLHGVTARDVSTFLTIVRRDRALLEAEGGVPYLLQAEGVTNLSVAEVQLAVVQGLQLEQADPACEFTLGREISQEQRRHVSAVLRSGPPAIVGLLQRLYATVADTTAIDSTAAGVLGAQRAMESLHAIIASEPEGDQATLHANLAAAVLLLGEPVRGAMEHALATQVGDNETARAVLSRLATQRLVALIPLSALQADTPARGAAASEAPDVQQDLSVEPAVALSAPQEPAEPVPASGDLADVGALDDDAVMRDVVATLVDAFRSEDDNANPGGFSRPLALALSWLIDRQDYGALRAALHGLQDVTDSSGARAAAVSALVAGLLQESAVRVMLGRLWAPRTDQEADDVRACLAFLAAQSVPLLMRILAREPHASARRKLCDVIVDIARDEVDAVGAFLKADQWHLVRNAANILGRLQDPRSVPHLIGLATHPEYRVRREAVESLVRVGTEEAEAGIAIFLGDRDSRIRLKAVLSLNDSGVRMALPALLAMLERADPLGRNRTVRAAIVAAIGRAKAAEAVPALEQLAGRPAFAPWSRRLRRRAREALLHLGTRRSGDGSELSRLETEAGNP
ncbi:MAG: HEAT repeat domain-containing protein [Armatimonadota bacterium]|nr:HEAT repeat domain-containing protein [Armatimonadota bacterium]